MAEIPFRNCRNAGITHAHSYLKDTAIWGLVFCSRTLLFSAFFSPNDLLKVTASVPNGNGVTLLKRLSDMLPDDLEGSSVCFGLFEIDHHGYCFVVVVKKCKKKTTTTSVCVDFHSSS